MFRFILHLSLQYFTSSQTFFHFFRHVNGRWQTMHIFCGRSDFFTDFINQGFLKILLHFLNELFFSLPSFYQRFLPAYQASD